MCNVGSEAFDSLDAGVERIRHVAQRPGQLTDFIAPAREIGDFHASADAPANTLRAISQSTHWSGYRASEEHGDHDHDARRHEKHLHDGDALRFDHIVDISTLCGQHEHASHGAESLHRYCDRNDHFATVVDPHHAGVRSIERLGDFLVALAILGPEFVVEWQIAATEPPAQSDEGTLHDAWLVRAWGRKVEAQNVAAAIEVAAVENKHAVAIIDPCTCLRRRNQTAQHRRNPLRIDRKLYSGEGIIRRAVTFPGLQFQQPFGIDRDGV